MTDSEVHGLLTLPLEILDIVMQMVVASTTHKKPIRRPTSIEPYSFGEFYKTRKDNRSSPFALRMVCRHFNASITRFVFRDIYIRPTWNWLSINPPLRALAIDSSPAESDFGQVFRQHARVLRLNLSHFATRIHFEDDSFTDLADRHICGPEPVTHDYHPLTRFQKADLFTMSQKEVMSLLPIALTSLKDVIEIQYDVYPHPSVRSSWLRNICAQALSGLPQLQNLVLRATPSNPRWLMEDLRSMPGSEPEYLLKELSGIVCLRLYELQAIDFSFPMVHFQLDLDDLWRTWTKTREECGSSAGLPKSHCLRSVSLNAAAISMDFFRFLASFDGLEALVLTTRDPQGGSSLDHQALSSYFLDTVLKSHYKTLKQLHLPCFVRKVDRQGHWTIKPSSPMLAALARCTELRMLTTVLHINPTRRSIGSSHNLELFLKQLHPLSTLHELHLICTGSTLRLNDIQPYIDHTLGNVSFPHAEFATAPPGPAFVGIIGIHWPDVEVLRYELTWLGGDLGWHYEIDEGNIKKYKESILPYL